MRPWPAFAGWHGRPLEQGSEPTLPVSVLFDVRWDAQKPPPVPSALDHVVAAVTLGVDVGTGSSAVLLPRPRAAEPAHLARSPRTAGRCSPSAAWAPRRRKMVDHKTCVGGGDGRTTATVSRTTCSIAESDLARPVQGMDPRLGLVEATGIAASNAGVRRASTCSGPLADCAAGRLAQRALAHELVGTGQVDAGTGPRSTRWSGCSSGSPSASFQAESTPPAGRDVGGHRVGRVRPRGGLGGRRPHHGGGGQSAGRPGRPHGGSSLPAGPGRDRLHHRAPLPPLRPASLRTRSALRVVAPSPDHAVRDRAAGRGPACLAFAPL